MFKSGFVSVIGRPNVGKSTLLNKVIGEKISIISDKPQTTRNKIQMVYTDEDSQIVFLDTPGVQRPKNKLGEYMLGISRSSLSEVDVITFVVDNSLELGKLDSYILNQLKNIDTPKVLIINKIDLLSEDEVNKLVEKFATYKIFEEIIPISAKDGMNIENYLKTLKNMISEGPKYFPEDMITDQPEKFIISELIREKALHNLEEEVPHGIFVKIEDIKSRENKDLIDVYANIYCERNSQKGIIIGKGGKKLKQIGSEAREDIQKLLGSKVNLQLWVKVEKNWRTKEEQVKRFGYK